MSTLGTGAFVGEPPRATHPGHVSVYTAALLARFNVTTTDALIAAMAKRIAELEGRAK